MCIANENGKLTITGNQCRCKRTASEKGKQIINSALLHLSPEKLYLLSWLHFTFVNSLLSLLFLPCVWHSVLHHLYLSISDAISLSSFSFVKFDICMQLKFDDSSCGNPFGAKWANEKKHSNSFEQASESASNLIIFFVVIRKKWKREIENLHVHIRIERCAIDSFSFFYELSSYGDVDSLHCRMQQQQRVALGHPQF